VAPLRAFVCSIRVKSSLGFRFAAAGSRIQSRRYHCDFVHPANDRVLADAGLLVHDRACHTRASADIAVMEEDGVSNLGPFLDDDPGADY
jgi:hypothetical protein